MRRLLMVSLIAICSLFLCSCGTGQAADSSSKAIESLKQEIAELQEKIVALEEENCNLRAEHSNSISDNISNSSAVETSPVDVILNSPFSVGDIMEITLTGAEWNDSVLPSNTDSSYSYYEDKADETYFIVHGTMTSNAGDSFDIQWCTEATLLINGKYHFSATMEFEDGDGKGFGESIKPLQTRNFILRSSVSDAVYALSESVQVNLAIPDNEEQLDYFYDEDHSNAKYRKIYHNL